MDSRSILDTVHAERAALANDLASLSPDQWGTPSLCAGWTVRDTVAHMTAAARLSGPSFLGALIASGFRFERVQRRGIAQNRGADATDTLVRFRAIITSDKRPPGPVQTILGETIIHAEDVRRPLGVTHDYPMEAILEAVTFFSKSNLIIGSKKRVAGLTLRATDTTFAIGSGPDVSGPALTLLLAMTGRASALAQCDGAGVETMRSRV